MPDYSSFHHSKNALNATKERLRSRMDEDASVRGAGLRVNERWVLSLLCLKSALAVWAIALIPIWTQWVFAALSFIGAILVFAPLRKDAHHSETAGDQPSSTSRLLRFPMFWAGILVIAYIGIQWANPAFGYEENPDFWRSFPIDHIAWLPSSVSGSFDRINPARMLLMFGSVWLLLCYGWLGMSRRRTLHYLLWFLFANALAYCALAIIQKQTDAKGIFWNYEVFPNFFSSVPYKNRGAALLYLLMGSSMALYFMELRQMRERLAKSGPHLLVLLGIFVQYAVLWTSFSRGGLAVGTLLMVAFLLMVMRDTLRFSDGSVIIRTSGIVCGIVLVVSSMLIIPQLPDYQKTIAHFATTEKHFEDFDLNGRGPVTLITLEMAEHRKWFGWGAGSWRYVFPYYQVQHPELLYRGSKRLVWDDAHNDWAQYLSEFGRIGMGLLVLSVLAPTAWLLLRFRRTRESHWIVVLTLNGLLLHALIELLLQNLAILAMGSLLTLILFRIPLKRVRQS